MKKHFLFLVTAMLLSTTTAMAQGGTTGPLTWNISGNTLTISGQGAMPNYDSPISAPWSSYMESIHTVLMENGVTTIGNYAFYYCENLTSLTMPNSVTTIGEWAFYYCLNLPSVTIPDNVTTIGVHAFSRCMSLPEIILPAGVTTIGRLAFYECATLTSIIIPASVTTIGEAAFYFCTSLTSIEVESENNNYASENGVLFDKSKTILVCCPSGKAEYVIPNSVITIGEWAFGSCQFYSTSITIPNSVTSIGDNAFVLCGLFSITIPGSVITIGEHVFYGCSHLTSVIISDGVTTIGAGAFFLCTNLNSITIPNSIITIGDEAFRLCQSLTSIDVGSENNNYASENGVLFDKSKTTLICYPAGKAGSYIVPNSVTTIVNEAFYNSQSLTSIIISDNVTAIGWGAFAGCISLTSAILPNGLTTIEHSVFQHCTSLTSVTIPNSLTSIKGFAFNFCTSLDSIIIPSNVTSIGNFAFGDCTSLTSITNLNLVPVAIEPKVFDEVEQSACNLLVATSAVPDYENAAVWKDFNIIGGGALVNPIPNNGESGYTDGDGLYEGGGRSTATVTAIAFDDYEFIGWTINGVPTSTDNPYSFVVIKDVELVANFFTEGTKTYLVGVSANNEEYGRVTGGQMYEANKTATVKATAKSGYKFVNWTKNGTEVSKNNQYSFTVTEDVELVANFETTVGIEQLQVTSYELQVYPNPTKGEIQVTSYELQVTSIEVYDVMGRMVTNVGALRATPLHCGTINIAHLPAGIYFIKIKTDAGEVARKIVKQ